MPARHDDAIKAIEHLPDPSTSRALMIEVAAHVIAAGLAEPADLANGHGLSADDLKVAAMLAEQEPANVFEITPAHSGDALLLAIEAAAFVIAGRYTTPERYKAACLADRPDADDLMAVILTAARQHSAPPPPSRKPSWNDILPLDEGGPYHGDDLALSSALGGGFTPRPKSAPIGSGQASMMCLRGKHQPGPVDRNGWATCMDCGTALVTCLPGGPIETKEGNAPAASADAGAAPFIMPSGPSYPI